MKRYIYDYGFRKDKKASQLKITSDKIKALQKCIAHTDQEIDPNFDLCLAEIAKSNFTHKTAQLLLLLDDEFEFPEVMFGIVHTAETAENADYVA